MGLTSADLLREAERLDRQEAAMKRDRLKLAKRLMEKAQELGGAELMPEKPGVKQKRRYVRRRRPARAPSRPAPSSIPSQSSRSRPQATHRVAKAPGRKFSETGWTGTMLRILTASGQMMTYADLKAEIAKTPLGPKLLSTDKSFYGALGKLEDRKQAIRHSGRIGTPIAYERFMRDVAAGIVKDEPVRNTGGEHTSPTKSALFAFLENNIQGAPIAEIIGDLEKRPDLDLTGKNSKTAVYNLIARLVRREVLTKRVVLFASLAEATVHITGPMKRVLN